MLGRSWSLLSLDSGFQQPVDASPVDRRRIRRSKSFSGREMSKELRMVDVYEEHHRKRVVKQVILDTKLAAILELKRSTLEKFGGRCDKFLKAPLANDPQEEYRRVRELVRKVVEEMACERDDEGIAAATKSEMQQKEQQFAKKLHLIPTLQIHHLSLT